ncbi:hypothetical protein LJC64_03470 [Ruminococcaceae bacterium OttesenSCG-928-A11]|nr:hypothetical protein [Ruminococcaceae bacterium OttesenSCG-928-A11]
MSSYRTYTSQSGLMKPKETYLDPFPPSYYEVERNAKAKLAQMTRLPKKKKV